MKYGVSTMKKLLAISIFLLVIGNLAAAQPEKVAQVERGELKEAYASWWGFNAEDSTEALQAAVASKVPKLIIDKMPSPWILGKTLRLVSNQEIVFEEGVELLAKKGAFKKKTDVLVELALLENVTLRGEGKGATLRMRKADYHSDEYQKAEWRHAISLKSSRNINILNLSLVESGGDGIYLGIARQGVIPTDIVIRDVVCDGNNRQGISIIAGINVLIENTKLINTKGTAPEAGIDFEPNRNNEPIRNIVMRKCFLANNAGHGIHFWIGNMDSSVSPLDVVIEDCVSQDAGQACFSLCATNGPGKTLQGRVLVKNCIFENGQFPVRFRGTSNIGFKTTFENVVMKNMSQKNPKVSPIVIQGDARDEEPSGNIHFQNVRLYDNMEREPLAVTPNGQVGGLDNISGSIVCVTEQGEREFKLTNEWAKANYPVRSLFTPPPYDMSGVKLVPLGNDQKMTDFSKIPLRHTGKYLLYANQGDEIRFTLNYGQLGRYEGTEAAVTCTLPSSKEMPLEPIPFKTNKDYCIEKAPETGLYTVAVKSNQNLSSMVRCNRPLVIEANGRGTDFCTGKGDIFFYVPPKTPSFCVNFWGEGAEGLKVTIFDMEGKQLWQKDDISLIEQFHDDGELAQNGGIFHVRIEAPTHLATIEDYSIRIVGIPTYIGLAPNLLMKPEKP
ncbi:MAG: right-handed parallel beta-helix repeat-containing protein [Victivallales bacterium]|nr:right-handed parallel beta-helix repeat-containing protein [Victivallales bacterium]